MEPEQREEIVRVINDLKRELLEAQSDQHREAVGRRIDWWWKRIA